MSWAGVPRRVLVDLDSAFKGDFLQIMNERSVLVRCAAGQAHWQNGLAERHGGAWKEIFKKVVEDHSILNNEVTRPQRPPPRQKPAPEPERVLPTVGVRDLDEDGGRCLRQ